MVIALLATTKTLAQSSPGPKPLIAYQRSAEAAKPAAQAQTLHQDDSVLAANFSPIQEAQKTRRVTRVEQPPRDPRQLAPQSASASNPHSPGAMPPGRDALPFAVPKIESLSTAGGGLAIVVGLFMVCMWLLRRSGPKPTTPLPKEVVTVLGRTPMAARNFAHLIRVGNKLVLVALTPDGAAPITEITDPAEVDRLLGLCMRNHKHSTTAEFQQVLQQLANEPAKGFLGNEAHALSPSVRR